jgi:CheY-like chemotaxis protein
MKLGMGPLDVCDGSLPDPTESGNIAPSGAELRSHPGRCAVRLISKDEAAKAPRQGKMKPDVANLSGLRILVVEDSHLVADTMTEILEEFGCTVVGPVSRLRRALEMVSESELDGAILDVNLAGEFSFPVAAALAARGIPYIFTTGYDDIKVLPPTYRSRPRLSKPFHTRDLLSALVEQLSFAKGE